MTEELDTEPSNPKRGIYLLPNLITTGALFSGFYSIVLAGMHNYEGAAVAIFVALVLDGLDGRVARLTNTQSAFGAQYDSLSDVVSFGVAPALVLHSWGLSQLGKIGWVAAFFYTAATALRLARFNIQLEVQDKRYFHGLPCPAAAAMVASFIWVASLYEWRDKNAIITAAAVSLAVALLQVSNIRYYSFKELDLRQKVPFITLLGALLIFIFITLDPPSVLLCFFGLYVISGPILRLKQGFRKTNVSLE